MSVQTEDIELYDQKYIPWFFQIIACKLPLEIQKSNSHT